jgi:hypothetical protein
LLKNCALFRSPSMLYNNFLYQQKTRKLLKPIILK